MTRREEIARSSLEIDSQTTKTKQNTRLIYGRGLRHVSKTGKAFQPLAGKDVKAS